MIPKPCPYCDQQPIPQRSDEGHYLECSNLVDCPGWPYTESYPTPEQAADAWNQITKPASDS